MAISLNARVIDGLLTLFVFSPLVVFYWSSSWNLQDRYILRNNLKVSATISTGASFVIMFSAFILQDAMKTHITVSKKWTYAIGSRIWTYFMTWAITTNWRGVWTLFDIYTGETFLSGGIDLAIGTVGLVLLRSYRNVLTSPGLWTIDLEDESRFSVNTCFRTKKGSVLYVLDVLFSVLVVSTLVVLVWRGTWLMFELSIYPGDLVMQGVVTLIMGNVLAGLLIVLEQPAMTFSTSLEDTKPMARIAFENFFVFWAYLSGVIYWMGLWQLLDSLFKDNLPYFGEWMLHIVGGGGLICFKIASSLQYVGVQHDGEFPFGGGLVQSPPYYGTFFKKEAKASKDGLKEAIREAADGKSYSPGGSLSLGNGTANPGSTTFPAKKFTMKIEKGDIESQLSSDAKVNNRNIEKEDTFEHDKIKR